MPDTRRRTTEGLVRDGAPVRSRRCTTCGSGQSAVSAGPLDRCGHCGALLAPGVEPRFVVEGRDGAVARLVAPGRSEIHVRRGPVLPLRTVLGWVFTAELVAFVLSAIGEELGLARTTTSTVAFLAVGLGACVGAVIAGTTQRVVVTDGGLELSRSTSGREWHRRQLGTHALRMEPIAGVRPRLRLSDGAATADLLVDSTATAEWVRRELVASIQESRQAGPVANLIHCTGCGGPLTTLRGVEDAARVDCPHCGMGLVSTRGGVILGPARLVDDSRSAPPDPRSERQQRTGAAEWVFPSALRRDPAAAGVVTVLGLAVAGGAGWLVALVLQAMGRFPFVVVVPVIALGAFAAFILRTTLGGHRILVDETALAHEITTGPFTWARTRVPLARVVEVRTHLTPLGHGVAVRTATGSARLEIPSHGTEVAGALRELLDALDVRLTALGRTVERLGKVAPPPA